MSPLSTSAGALIGCSPCMKSRKAVWEPESVFRWKAVISASSPPTSLQLVILPV